MYVKEYFIDVIKNNDACRRMMNTDGTCLFGSYVHALLCELQYLYRAVIKAVIQNTGLGYYRLELE